MPKLFVFWFLVDVYVNNISLKKADTTIYVYIYILCQFGALEMYISKLAVLYAAALTGIDAVHLIFSLVPVRIPVV